MLHGLSRAAKHKYNGPSKLNPLPLPAVVLSPEETVQADTAIARARTRDAAWLSHVHTRPRLGHEVWHGCPMCTQKINQSSGLGSTLI